MQTHRTKTYLPLALLLLAMQLPAANAAGTGEPLRWKFKVGDKLSHRMKQTWMSMAIERNRKGAEPAFTWSKFINDAGPNAKADKDARTKKFNEMYKGKPIEWVGRVKSVTMKPDGTSGEVIVNMDPTQAGATWADVKVITGEALKTQAASLKPQAVVKFSGKLTKLGDANSPHELEAKDISAQPAMSTMIDQLLDMTWNVQGVDEATGEAVIGLKFDRVKMKMTMPIGSFEFDSTSETAPTGLGAAIAPMYKALTEGEFEITVTARGEVKDVKVPDQVIESLKSAPAATKLGDLATPEGFKKIISQGALTLPENPPKPGDTWSTKVEMNNQSLGRQSVETIYRFEGTKEIGGTKFAVIRPALKMVFENAAKPSASEPQQPPQMRQLQMNIKDQSSDGEVLFDIKAGRMHSCTIKQNVTIEAGGPGEFVDWRIAQRIDVYVTAGGDGEKKSGDAPKTAGGAKKKDQTKAK